MLPHDQHHMSATTCPPDTNAPAMCVHTCSCGGDRLREMGVLLDIQACDQNMCEDVPACVGYIQSITHACNFMCQQEACMNVDNILLSYNDILASTVFFLVVFSST